MNRHADELRGYEEEAERQYDDYEEEAYEEEEGYEEDYDDEFVTGLEGRDDSYDDDSYEEVEYVDEYDSYESTSIGRIDPNDRTLTVSVSNTSGDEADVIVFGGNENAAQAAGVTVFVGESSHNEVREESKANPFKILGMKMSVSDPLQFDRVLRIVRRTSTGASFERVYQPRNATSPQNFSQQLIDDATFEMDVTGQDSLRFRIKPNTTVGFTFTIKARANMGNLLRGSNVAELSTAPRATGLPQIDLVRKPAPTTALEGKPKVRKIRKIVRKVPKKIAKLADPRTPFKAVKKIFRRRKKKR